MGNKYDHWCDNQHQEPSEDNKFVIGDLAHDIFNRLEKYLLYDIHKDMLIAFEDTVQGTIAKNYVVKRVYSILENAEEIELIVKDANSIYALYGVDYERRRQLWLEARGKCFRLIQQISHITSILVEAVNIEKYIKFTSSIYKLSGKIKNVMISDDEKKKKYCKTYLQK